MFTKVLIGKSLQLEKTDTAKSKNNIGKGFCGVHFEMRRRKYIHMLNFEYEDDIRIKNKYFATIYYIGTSYLSNKTINRPPQSHETIPLRHILDQCTY
jgi:hypothetical protein